MLFNWRPAITVVVVPNGPGADSAKIVAGCLWLPAEQETGRLDGANNRTRRCIWRDKEMGLEGLVGCVLDHNKLSCLEMRCSRAARELSLTIKAPWNRKWNTVSSKEE